MKTRNISAVLFCVLLAGCHTIRPLGMPDSVLVSSLLVIKTSTVLLIDQDYSGYISKDRGNALADPQTYHVGAALVPLTRHYFEKSFQSIRVVNAMPEGEITENYLIFPKVKNFENTIRMTEQIITLTLEADIYDQNLNRVQTVTVQGSGRGDLGIFSSSKDSALIVDLAIQNTLINLLKQIDAKLALGAII